MTKVNVRRLASVIRSKNSGPFELTLDIMFKTPEIYQMIKEKKIFTKELIASLYKIPEEKVLYLVEFDPAHAIKATIERPRVAGDLSETDIYGAQQHAPLLYLDVDCDPELLKMTEEENKW